MASIPFFSALLETLLQIREKIHIVPTESKEADCLAKSLSFLRQKFLRDLLSLGGEADALFLQLKDILQIQLDPAFICCILVKLAPFSSNLWICTYWKGVDYFDKQTGQFTHYNKIERAHV